MNISALLAGLLSGILGSMGLGGGSVLVIYLSLFKETEQLKAQGINLLFFVPIATLSVIIYAKAKKIKWKIILKLILSGLLGTFAGWMVASYFQNDITAKVFGGLLIVMGVLDIIKKDKKNCCKRDE